MYSFLNLESVHCSMSGSNCCFLTYIQISQEAGKVVWHSDLFKNFPTVCCDPDSQNLVGSQWNRSRCFSEFPCFFHDPMNFTVFNSRCRTGHGTIDWFQIGKGMHQGCTLSPCLFNLYAECIIRNAGLDETLAEIKIAGRNINNLRYANGTTLTAESKEELKNLLMKVKKENEKVGLKLSIQKTKIMASDPITSWQVDEERVERMADFIFLGSKITAMVTVVMKLKGACSLEERVWPI